MVTVMLTVPPQVSPHSSSHSNVALYTPEPLVVNVQLLPLYDPGPDVIVQPVRVSSASLAETGNVKVVSLQMKKL